MSDRRLANLRVMVVEDEYLLAEDMRKAFQSAGAEVVGPVPERDRALALLKDKQVDFAVLDVDVKGETVFPVAASLRRAKVPFVFATGFSPRVIPEEYRDVPHFAKPISVDDLVEAVGRLLATRSA